MLRGTRHSGKKGRVKAGEGEKKKGGEEKQEEVEKEKARRGGRKEVPWQ